MFEKVLNKLNKSFAIFECFSDTTLYVILRVFLYTWQIYIYIVKCMLKYVDLYSERKCICSVKHFRTYFHTVRTSNTTSYLFCIAQHTKLISIITCEKLNETIRFTDYGNGWLFLRPIVIWPGGINKLEDRKHWIYQ